MSTDKYKRQLLATGDIIETLHYSVFAINWWIFIKKTPEKYSCIPICVNMRIKFELNKTEFIIRIIKQSNNIYQPGYICETDQAAMVYSTPTAAINETYKKLFNVQTRYSGPLVMGFDDEKISEELQVGVLFFPFKISVHNITVFIFALGSSILEELNFTDPGYQSSFSHKFRGKQSLIVQSILKDKCQKDIYQQAEKIQTYSGISPKDAFEQCLKRKISVAGLSGKTNNQISNDLISAAKKYAHTNGPGCVVMTKPIITKSRVSEIQDQEFEAFFASGFKN
ncbi:hypothetical protein RhiirA1_401034 [Rhizophagus irregularis]|uniref:Uncharacterized protein n=1 Tax=Rhizophagus irregularis TaxID=588596 RepID=A0A2N0R3M1_9GLOM|nr:hypothetical protein RhiirA1_401034 [Rhizophagus irregularis]